MGSCSNYSKLFREFITFNSLNNKSPDEAFYHELPKICHLRVFWCKAYPLKVNNKDDKFDSFAKDNCNIIWYGDKEEIYWILDKNKKLAFRSRDVKFNESFKEFAEINISRGFECSNKNSDVQIRNENADPDNVLNEDNTVENQKDADNTDQNENESDGDEIEPQKEQTENIKTRLRVNPKQTVAEFDANLNDANVNKKSINKSTKDKDEDVNWILSTIDEEEPNTVQDALNGKFKDKWSDAIASEINSLK